MRRGHPAFHKVAGVEEAIKARGAELRLLPEYLPDLNPIEMVFHPLKALLRKAAERTVNGLERAFAPSIEDSNFPNAQAISVTVAMIHYDRDVL